MISNMAAKVAAYRAHFSGCERTATDVIMALTCRDVFLRIRANILNGLFNWEARPEPYKRPSMFLLIRALRACKTCRRFLSRRESCLQLVTGGAVRSGSAG
jgi:hypothetical protein